MCDADREYIPSPPSPASEIHLPDSFLVNDIDWNSQTSTEIDTDDDTVYNYFDRIDTNAHQH